MADLTWYSREGADQRFLTKAEAASLATKGESTQGDAALGTRLEAVKATAEAALPSTTAASTYATKAEVESVRQSIPQVPAAPDLSDYATKSEMQAADTSLGQRIDSVSGAATAAATKAELAQYATTASVAGTYATKESLAGYLTAADAESSYATKAQLAQAQLGGNQNAPDLSGLATKAEMRQADSGLGARIDQVKTLAEAALPSTTAASTYATKADVASADSALEKRLEAVKKTADAALSTPTAAALYATKAEVSATRSIAEGALPKTEAATKYAAKTDLAAYATSTSVASTYATEESLTSATAPIAGLSSKVSSLETAVGSKADASALSGLLSKTEAASAYATKADLAKVQAGGGGKADLSKYLTRDDAYDAFVQSSFLNRNLELYATLEALNATARRVDALGKTLTPFKPGERYYSPVTYFWPDYYQKAPNVSKWAQILRFAGSLGIVILNRNSGNWDTYDKDFDTQANLALAAGAKRAVFYVKTQYLAATLPAGDPGRNNVPDVDKYTEDYIFGQVAKAKSQYGDVCQGVFLDETINGWGAQAGRVPAYKRLIDRIRAAYGNDFLIVVNSGSNISEEMCKLDFDVCMMFEKDAAAFLVEDPGTPILPDHMKAYPSTRWWAAVHGVTSENYRSVFDKADKLGIAHLYITDGQLREDLQRGGQWEPVGNPYANPPSDHIHELVVPWLKGYLPLKLEVDELRTRPKVLSLGRREAVPSGTPAGTIIVRKDS